MPVTPNRILRLVVGQVVGQVGQVDGQPAHEVLQILRLIQMLRLAQILQMVQILDLQQVSVNRLSRWQATAP